MSPCIVRDNVIICTRARRPQKCAYCSNDSTLLCDFKLGGGKSCDKPICKRCSVSIGPGVDHCRIHSIRGDIETP
jgi:hypothetical protein